MIKLIKILFIVFIAIALICILSMHIMSCNTFKPLPSYKDVTFSGWTVDHPNEIQSFTLLFSADQSGWQEIKTIAPTDKQNYLDTTNFRNGYYRLRVNLKTGAVINSDIEKMSVRLIKIK